MESSTSKNKPFDINDFTKNLANQTEYKKIDFSAFNDFSNLSNFPSKTHTANVADLPNLTPKTSASMPNNATLNNLNLNLPSLNTSAGMNASGSNMTNFDNFSTKININAQASSHANLAASSYASSNQNKKIDFNSNSSINLDNSDLKPLLSSHSVPASSLQKSSSRMLNKDHLKSSNYFKSSGSAPFGRSTMYEGKKKTLEVSENMRMAFLCSTWYILSSVGNVLNKHILTKYFPGYPTTVSFAHILCIVLALPVLFKIWRISGSQPLSRRYDNCRYF